MKIKDLIEHLKLWDGEWEVWVETRCDFNKVSAVVIDASPSILVIVAKKGPD